MKRAIALRLCAVILIGMLAAVLINYRIQIRTAQDNMVRNAELRIVQMTDILEQNEADVAALREGLQTDYIIRAKAAAYIVESRPEVEGDVAGLRGVAALLQVDELHLFDVQGTIYSGTEPKYYGYSFHSGEQMQFFLPLLQDRGLELCQDVTPNTAEGKLMQYVALWREDGKGIVQIGMEPVRLMEAMRKNELPYLFARMTTETGLILWAVDGETGEVLGSTDTDLVGRSAAGLGLIPKEEVKGGFSATVNGVPSYCVFRRQEDGMWLGLTRSNEHLYWSLSRDRAFFTLSIAAISAALILLLLRYIDRYMIRGVNTVIEKLQRITDGDLDTRVAVDSAPELAALSRHINRMVESLLENTDKLSLIFQSVEIPIAAYEYNPDMARVLATSRLGDILGCTGEEFARLLADPALFRRTMEEMRSRPLEDRPDGDVFRLAGSEPRYVKLNTYQDGKSIFGVVVDVTEETRERLRIAQERDVDLLTGLVSRRAFFRTMDALFQDPDALGCTAILMADVDHLKRINDTYGHEYGDKLLRAAARLLLNCGTPDKVAARLSGDEYILFLYGCAGEEEVRAQLKDLEERMGREELPVPGGGTFPVRLSGGYVLSRGGGQSYRTLLRLADQTMYQVKRSGKGRFLECRLEEPPQAFSPSKRAGGP